MSPAMNLLMAKACTIPSIAEREAQAKNAVRQARFESRAAALTSVPVLTSSSGMRCSFGKKLSRY